MNLGIITPVVTQFPGVHADWEHDATIDDIVRVAQGAERLGYDLMACPEHIVIPAEISEGEISPGNVYWDPLPTFGYVAAHTSRIRLATVVLPLPYHHPLDIAKRYGTLDRICGGRLVLGVGAGYLKPEFAALGIPFEGRNELTDDAIRAIRASFGRPQPEYEGTHFRFSGMVVDPCGVQEHVPIWIGGNTRRSLRRAVELGDGWYPFGITPQQVTEWLADASATEAWRERERPLEVALATRVDPIGAPEAATAAARELRDAGAGTIMVRVIHDSLERYLDQLEAMAKIAASL